MIGFFKNWVTGGGKPKIGRGDVLRSRPVRNPAITWEREVPPAGGKAVALLKLPRRSDRWGNIVAKIMRLPDSRRLELDEIGSDVWEMCDGNTTVDEITRAIVVQYRLNRRQAETSVTAYLRQLAERRLIAVRTGGAAVKSAKAKRGGAAAAGAARRTKRA